MKLYIAHKKIQDKEQQGKLATQKKAVKKKAKAKTRACHAQLQTPFDYAAVIAVLCCYCCCCCCCSCCCCVVLVRWQGKVKETGKHFSLECSQRRFDKASSLNAGYIFPLYFFHCVCVCVYVCVCVCSSFTRSHANSSTLLVITAAHF